MFYNGKSCNRSVKGLSRSRLPKKNRSNHKEDLYCLNCFNSYNTENRLKEHVEICNKNDICCIILPKRVERISNYSHTEK